MRTASKHALRVSGLLVLAYGTWQCAFPELKIAEDDSGDGGGAGERGNTSGGGGSSGGGTGGDTSTGGTPVLTEECTANQEFCVGDAVFVCADDGMSSSEKEACGENQYCDVPTANCLDGLCAPNQPACDADNVAHLCNALGDAYEPDGAVDCTDSDETCVNGVCDGECAPEQTQCSGNGLQTCMLNGQYGPAVACENSTCLGDPGDAGCEGECEPEQERCSGNGTQACDENTGLYESSVTYCVSTTPHCSAGACGAPPSCQGLAVDCGTSSNESCCTSARINGGLYNRINGSYPASISGFRLDKFEVTVGRWRNFVSAWNGGWRPASGAGKHAHLNGGSGLANSHPDGGYEPGWNTSWESNVSTADSVRQGAETTWTSTPGSNEKRPINYLNWYEGYAFCIWDGGYLPSEAEWNYAAAGGSLQRDYPWAPPTAPNCSLANYFGAAGPAECYAAMHTVNVGVLAAGNGAFGQADLAGNVWEWNLDWYAASATAFAATCTDCAYLPSSASSRVQRGGAYSSSASLIINSSRNAVTPAPRVSSVGVRCARGW